MHMTILWEEKLSYMPTTTMYVKIISDGDKTHNTMEDSAAITKTRQVGSVGAACDSGCRVVKLKGIERT